MRWFASLVVLCLLAGTGPARPDPRRLRDDRSSNTLGAADRDVVSLAARRVAACTLELRREAAGPFTPPSPVSPPAPPSARALDDAPGPIAPVLLARAAAHGARGPPLG